MSTLEGRFLALPCVAGRALDGGPVVPERVAREIVRRRLSATVGYCPCGGRYSSPPMDPRQGCAPLLLLTHSAECERELAVLLAAEGCDARLLGYEVVRMPEDGRPHWLDEVEPPAGYVHVCRIPDERIEWPDAVKLPAEVEQ